MLFVQISDPVQKGVVGVKIQLLPERKLYRTDSCSQILFSIKCIQVVLSTVMALIQGNVSAGSIGHGSLQMVMSATPGDFRIGLPGVSGWD